jgi:hypothetical protein
LANKGILKSMGMALMPNTAKALEDGRPVGPTEVVGDVVMLSVVGDIKDGGDIVKAGVEAGVDSYSNMQDSENGRSINSFMRDLQNWFRR